MGTDSIFQWSLHQLPPFVSGELLLLPANGSQSPSLQPEHNFERFGVSPFLLFVSRYLVGSTLVREC